MNHPPAGAQRAVPHPRILKLSTTFILIVLLFNLVLGGCNMPTSGGTSAPDTSDPSLESTRAALSVQATMQAAQAEQDTQATGVAADATRIAGEVQATMLAQQAGELSAQSTQIAQQATQQAEALANQQAEPTQPPPPTNTPPPAQEPTPTVSAPEPEPTPDYEAMMKEAKILLFEDMAGMYEVRYIRNALDTMGLRYTDVGDAIGHYKSQLLSGTDWDLIISGAEARDAVQGEYFTYLLDHINNGAGVVIEVWNLDEIVAGKFSSILTKCGLQYQDDWWEPPAPSLWWLAPEHPVFHEPNEGMSLVNYLSYWTGDHGDLLRLAPGSEGTLLAGNIATERQRYGTIATCLDGRVIIQSFSSHDYHQDDVERLWANYIYNALRAHFIYKH